MRVEEPGASVSLIAKREWEMGEAARARPIFSRRGRALASTLAGDGEKSIVRLHQQLAAEEGKKNVASIAALHQLCRCLQKSCERTRGCREFLQSLNLFERTVNSAGDITKT